MPTYIEKIRKNLGYSQDDLATLIGVSRPYFAEIEKGRRDLTISQGKKLADALGVSFEDFLSKRLPSDPVLVITKDRKSQSAAEPEMRVSVPEKNIKKFKEVLLYILNEVGAKPNVGEGVLCKLMYFIDFDYYEKYEKQLMGAVYIKNHFGPTPAGFPQILKDMEEKNEIAPVMKNHFQYQQKKYLPLRSPDLNLISAQEIEHIDWVLARLGDKTAAEMREYSHRDVPWITATEQSVIDYESVFYRTPDFSVRAYDKL